jgi:hypothetical protein
MDLLGTNKVYRIFLLLRHLFEKRYLIIGLNDVMRIAAHCY